MQRTRDYTKGRWFYVGKGEKGEFLPLISPITGGVSRDEFGKVMGQMVSEGNAVRMTPTTFSLTKRSGAEGSKTMGISPPPTLP
jgi:hypothetical protein